MRRFRRFLLLLVTGSLLAGCGGQAYTPDDVSGFVWPDPPERPRVRMVTYIFSDLDVRNQNSAELLFGMEDLFRFKKPHRAVADDDGNIFVSDTIARTVYVVSFERGEITQLFNPLGWGMPGGLAIDQENDLLAATTGSQVALFNLKNRRFKGLLAKPAFSRPTGLAFDPKRKILYVADTRKSEVYAYDYSGRLLMTVAQSGVKPGQVYWPSGLAVDDEGRLYVVDTMNFRVQIFNPDGSFYGTFGQHGTVPGAFARPKDIALTSDGLILVTDAAFGNFQVFDRQGNVYLFVGSPGARMNQLSTPQGIFVDKNDKIYVVDQGSGMIKIYQLYTDRWYDEHPEEAAKYPAPRRRLAPEPQVPERIAAGDADGAETPESAAAGEAEQPAYDPDELIRGW